MYLYCRLTRNHREEKLVAERPEQLQSQQIVNYSQFAERLGIPSLDPVTRDLFSLLSPNESGQVDFSKYLLSVLMVERASSQQDMLDMAFELCGVEGRLSAHQLSAVLQLVLQLAPADADQLSRDITTDSMGLTSYCKNPFKPFCTLVSIKRLSVQ